MNPDTPITSDSTTPTWDRIQLQLHYTDTATITRETFADLRSESREMLNKESREKAMEFITEAGTRFGSAVAKAIGLFDKKG